MDPVNTSWLEPHEMHLELKDVLRKVPGASRAGDWEVDGITYQSPPVIYASQVKYIERVTSFVQASNCRCNLIVKTIVFLELQLLMHLLQLYENLCSLLNFLLGYL
mgnify:CR=1 FL=1